MKKRDKAKEVKEFIDQLEVLEYSMDIERLSYREGSEYTLTIKGIAKQKEDVVIICGQRYSIKKI